jgi:hypothetical protein
VRWPGQLKPGSVNDELVCLTDLAPTVLGLAGVKNPGYIQGRALLGEQEGPEPQYAFGGRNRMDLTSDDLIRTCRDKRFRYIHNFTPQVPYAQKIPYMEKSPILQEWRRLNAAGELAGPQTLWFAPHKPEEELYDTTADPDEANNLAGKPEHAATLKRMRTALDTWMTDIHELGGVPEEQLIERFWPGHKQPVTATPVIETAADGTVTITCATPGASIGYRLGKSQAWDVFATPFKVKEALHAKAIRLGYKVSKEIS